MRHLFVFKAALCCWLSCVCLATANEERRSVKPQDKSSSSSVGKLQRKIQLHGLPNNSIPVVTAVAIHPQGNMIATAGDDHLVRLWNIHSGRLHKELRGHRDWVTAVAFSPDGSEVITGCRDRKVLVWDTATGRKKRSLGEHAHPITAIVVSEQNSLVAVAGFRAPLRVFDLASGEQMAALTCPCNDVRAIAFAPQTEFLAAAGRTGTIRVWKLATGTQRDIRANKRRITSLAFTRDHRLLSAGEDKVVRLWDANSGKVVHEYSSDTGKSLSMKLLDQSRFAVATTDNIIRLFSLDDPEPFGVLQGHTGSIAALDFHNHTLISGSFDTTVRVWSIAPLEKVSPPVAQQTIPTSHVEKTNPSPNTP